MTILAGDGFKRSVPGYARVCWWLLIGAMTLVGCGISVVASGLLNFFALLLLPQLAGRGMLTALRRDPFVVLFAGAFALLAISFVVDAKTPHDLLYIFNFITLVLALSVYVVGRRLAGPATMQRVLMFCLAGAVVSLVVGLVDVEIRHLPRASGYLTGSLIYARLAMLFGFVAGTGCLLPGRWRYIYALGPLLGIVACILAGARGVLICAPFLIVLFLVFLLLERSRRERWMIVGGFAAIGVIATAAALLLVDSSRFADIPHEIVTALTGRGGDADVSTQIRMAFYSAGWQLFLERPWLGYGWGEMKATALTVLDPAQYGDFLAFHNDFLDLAVSAGIAGILAMVMILVAPVAGALRSPRDALFRPRLYAALAISILYVLSGLTDIVLGFDMPTTALAMMSAVVLGAFRDPASELTPA